MKITVYQGDWFYNMGIIGFLRIIENAGKSDQVTIKDDHISFDSKLLEHFHEDYFEYFITQYSVVQLFKHTIERNINYAKGHSDKVKDCVKKIREELKKNIDKVKKFDEDNYLILLKINQEISKLNSYDEIEVLDKLSKQAIEVIENPKVNNKLSINKFKYYIGDAFFGQVSFFNNNKSILEYEELKRIMYKDYLSDIVEYGHLIDVIDMQDDKALKEFIEEKLKDMPKGNVKKLYTTISKKLKKGAVVSDIILYLQSDELAGCVMCGNYRGITEQYTEGHFVPLALSSENAKNMFWNFNLDREICAVCKLILFCTPAGATYIKKGYLSDDENEFYSFINMDTSINELKKYNYNLLQSRDKDHPFKAVIADMVTENKKKSEWQLSNILFVEFKASCGDKKCKLNYFNMPVYLAKFFKIQDQMISCIYNQKLRGATIDLLLNEKDLKQLITKVLFEKLKDIYGSKNISGIHGADCYRMVRVRYLVNAYKGGHTEVDDKKLKVIRFSGETIREKYVKDNALNKLSGISYRLLNTAKAGNKKDFMDTVLRLFTSAQESVPILFLDVMAEKELDFESIAYAFISGLISDKYDPKTENESK